MIKVKVKKTNEKIINISFLGHALYDDYGRDIVCAAVSSCVITSLNLITRNNPDSIKIKEEKNGLNVEVLNYDDFNFKVLINMLESLKEIEITYPKNISIKEEIIC